MIQGFVSRLSLLLRTYCSSVRRPGKSPCWWVIGGGGAEGGAEDGGRRARESEGHGARGPCWRPQQGTRALPLQEGLQLPRCLEYAHRFPKEKYQLSNTCAFAVLLGPSLGVPCVMLVHKIIAAICLQPGAA